MRRPTQRNWAVIGALAILLCLLFLKDERIVSGYIWWRLGREQGEIDRISLLSITQGMDEGYWLKRYIQIYLTTTNVNERQFVSDILQERYGLSVSRIAAPE